MGKPYKKGICERGITYGYVNDHHTVPKRIKKEKEQQRNYTSLFKLSSGIT